MVPFSEIRKIGEEKFEEEDMEPGQRWNQDLSLDYVRFEMASKCLSRNTK